jgi:glycosyltransferase involved in cell wall biosynthesis
MTPAQIVCVVPDKLGGVFSFVQDLLRFRRPDEFRYSAVRVVPLREQFTRATDPLRADEEHVVEHSLPEENIYAALTRLKMAIGEGPGVLVANDWLELALAHWRDPGKAVVAMVHGDFDYYYGLAQRHEPVIDAYVTYTEQVYRRMIALLPQRRGDIHLMRYGVPVPADARVAASGPLRLLFVGRLHRDKGVLELPEIDRRLVGAGVRAQWTVHGEGPDRDELVAAWHDAGDRVSWSRHAPIDEVRALYQRHDVLVMPSRFEALPVALLEAGAAGVVPVVSDLPSGIPEVVELGVTGYRLTVGDVPAFAQAIVSLDRDRNALARMSEAVRARVSERFNVTTNVVAYQALFAAVQRRPRPRPGTLRLPYGSRLDRPWMPNTLVRAIRGTKRRLKMSAA